MPLKKPSELFGSSIVKEDNLSPAKKHLNDTYQQFQGSLSKIEELQGRVEEIYTQYPKTFEILANELDNRITKDDLDNTMFTHLTVVDENFKAIKEQVKGVNKKDLREFRNNVSELTDIVENLIDVELPQYRKRVTGNEIKISNNNDKVQKQLDNFSYVIEEKFESINAKNDNKFLESGDKVAGELNKFSSFLEGKIGEFEETKEDLLKIADTYKKLYTVVNDKYTEENNKIEEYSDILEEFNSRVNNFTDEVTVKISDAETRWSNYENYITKDFKELKEEIKSDLSSTRADVLVYEKHIEDYIQDHKKDIVDLKENVVTDLSNILKGDIQTNIRRLENKIIDIQEKYEAIKPEEIMEDLQEGLLNIPPDVKNSDPLTPLDQNYVTTKQLQDHYRLFINRVQEQLATLGGGGETQLKYLDDIVGIATNASAYDGKFLKYNDTIGKFEFSATSGGGYTLPTASAGTLGGIKIGSGLSIDGDGVVTASGGGSGITTEFVSSQTLNVVGLSTFAGTINLEYQGNIIGNNQQNISGINSVTSKTFYGDISGVGATFTNITGTLQTGAQPNVTSLGTLSSATVSGDINANGNIVGDNATNISGINSVTANDFESTVATGTAPFVVASTTKVANLNADLLDGRDTSSSGGNNVVMVTDGSGNSSLGSGTLTASSFVGNLTGIATGATRVYVDESEDDNKNYNILFTDIATGIGNSYHNLQVDDSGIMFNPQFNVLLVNQICAADGVNPITFFRGSYTPPGYGMLVANPQGTGIGATITGVGATFAGLVEATSFYSSGISTSNKMHVGVDTGVFNEDLVVTGDARVTGILTIGTGSITLDPSEEQIKVGNTMLKRNATTGNIDIMDNHGKFKDIRVKGGDAASKNEAIAFAIALG